MHYSSDPFFVDLLVAQQQRLIDSDAYARAIAFIENQEPNDARLGPLLLEWGILSESEATQITRAADSYMEVLRKLAPGVHSPGTDVAGDTPADVDPLVTVTPTPAANRSQDPAAENKSDAFATIQHAPDSERASETDRPAIPRSTRFEKIAPHAEGGLGKVWLATDSELHRRVAVKEIREKFSDDPECQARFVREAEITGSLEHPGIVPVYGLGAHESGEPYYAMRFIEGKTLRQAIQSLFAEAPNQHYRDRNWRVQFRRILNRFLDVCNTIEYAHSRGVLHRDIKPDNIILGAYGETLLVDWGLAKSIDSHRDRDALHLETRSEDASITLSGSTVGTPAYMSPEQAGGGRLGEVTKASDIFSLGATLFQLLSGQTLLQNSSQFPEAAVNASLWPKDPTLHVHSIPLPLASICRKALAFSPGDRYATAAKLAEDIENWLADQPVAAHRETLPERLARTVRQRPTLSASIAVSAVLLTLAALIGVYVRGEHELQLLEESQRREQLAEFHREQVTTSVESALAAAQAELRNTRFRSALELLEAASDQLANEPDMEALQQRTTSMLDRTTRLLGFQEYTDEAEDLIFRDSSRRSSILMQRGLKSLGVFQQLEWWTALPTEDLEIQQVHRIREQAYRCMFLLAAIRLKETIPPEISVQGMLALRSTEAEASNQAAIVLFDLLDAYRLSQGAELGRKFATERQATLARMVTGMLSSQPAIEWQPKNVSDLYVVGAALGYMTLNTTEATRQPFEAIWGFQNAEDVSNGMLLRASQLQPEHYWTQLVRAFFEYARGEDSSAWRSYLHTIALDPENWIGHAWFGFDLRDAAVALPKSDPHHRELLEKSSKHLERAVDLNPTSANAHFKYGDTLTWLMQDPREAVYQYLRGLSLQEPFESIDDPIVESSERWVVQSVANWIRGSIDSQWNHEDLYACLAWSSLLLGEIEDATSAGQEAIALNPDHEIARWVLARIDSAAGRHEAAEESLKNLCNQSPTFHHWFARAENHRTAGNMTEARSAYEDALQQAVTGWQKLASSRNIAAIALRDRDDRAASLVQSAIQLAPTESLDGLRALAKEMEHAKCVELIDDHHQSLLPIQRLDNDFEPIHAPIINGGFEMGLSTGWGDSLQKLGKPTLERFNGSQVLCVTDPKAAHAGKLGLDILNPPSSPADSYAVIEQRVPLLPGRNYRLSCWSRSLQGSGSPLELRVNDSIVLSLQTTAEWTQHTVTFEAATTDSLISLRIVQPAHIHLDQIAIERVESTAGELSAEPG